MASLCHPWFTTTNLSYRFPIFETSATALCGTTGIAKSNTIRGTWIDLNLNMLPTVESYPAKCWETSVYQRPYLVFKLDPLERVPYLCYRRQHLSGRLHEYGSEFKFLGTYIQMLVLQLALSLKGYPWIYWFIIFVFIKITIVAFPMYPSLDKPNCWDTPQNHQHLMSLGRPSAFSSQVHNIVTLLSGTAFIKTSKWLLKPPVQKYVSHWSCSWLLQNDSSTLVLWHVSLSFPTSYDL